MLLDYQPHTMEPEKGEQCCWITKVLLVLVLISGIATLIAAFVPQDPSFSVAIDSVSGLELPTPPSSTTDLTLNPRFNLTLRVASRSLGRGACMDAGTYVEVSYRCVAPGRDACMDAGTYVEVSYRCVPLAASATATERLCVGPRKDRSVQFVARGVAVCMPGHLLDGLQTDVRSGVEAFDVTVRRSGSGDDYGDASVASCGGRRVGNGADDLRNTCDASALESCPRTAVTGKHRRFLRDGRSSR